MDWELLFKPHILHRGAEYYRDAAVEDLKITDTQITAVVLGTEDYDVKIDIKDGIIEAMSCTCPYAADDNHCKHMAAVLFACQETEDLILSAKPDEPEWESGEDEDDALDDWKADVLPDFPGMTCKPDKETILAELIHNADDLTVRAFLYSILEKEPALQNRFRMLTQNVMTKGLLKEWRREIDRIFADAGWDDYIDYEQASYFTGELYSFLSSLDQRISAATADGIFKTVDYTLSQLQATDMDDSDGGLWCLFDFCYQIVGKLLPYCTAKNQLRIFDWAARQLDYTHKDGLWYELAQDCAMQFILQQFPGPDFLDKKLALTDKEVQKAARQTDFENVILPQKIKTHVLLMEQKGCPAEEQAAYIAQYKQYGSVCLLLSEFYEGQQDDAKAISVLEQAYAADSTPSYIARECCEKLKELYKKTGNQERYLQMLWDLALTIHVANIDLYRELKSQYKPEEWREQREKILTSWGTNPYAGQLYAEEKLYDRLLCHVQKHCRLSEVQQYESILKENFPDELLQLYEHIVTEIAVQGLGRPSYVKIVRILRKMKRLPGGPPFVQALVGQWRQQYKRRRAMMEELDKLT